MFSSQCLFSVFVFLGLMTKSLCSQSRQDKCEIVLSKSGLSTYNCSTKDLSEVPKLPEEAQVLDLSENRFLEVPVISESSLCPEDVNCWLTNTSSSCRLDVFLSRNKIIRFKDGAFHGLRCLRTLDLSYNQLQGDALQIGTFMEGFMHLKFLSLRGNPLGLLADNIVTFPFMPQLQELDLSFCHLDNISKSSLDDHRHLVLLNLSHNNLAFLHSQTFQGLSRLDTLDLRENQLTNFAEELFADLTSLKILLLSGNKITTFQPQVFSSDSSLKVLKLDHNQLTSIPYAAIDQLVSLDSLDLSYNPIKQVKAGTRASGLKNLTLNHLPNLSKLNTGSLASFPGLVSLSVRANKALRHIHPFLLGPQASSLRYVQLDNNYLASLPKDALPWQQLYNIKLAGNPWYCSQAMEWVLDVSGLDDSVICQEPLKLKGHDLRELKPNDLSRCFPIGPVLSVVLFCVLLPVCVLCAFLLWRRRQHLACCKVSHQGRYVTVYTRDIEEEGEQQVAIQLKVNVNRLKAVSNGSADDTKPFIRMQDKSEQVPAEDGRDEI